MSHIRSLVFWGIVGGCSSVAAAATIDCVKNAGSQVADVTNAIECNLTHWGEPWQQLVADCFKDDEQAAADAVADLQLLLEKQSAADAGAGGVAAIQARFPYGNEPKVVAALAKKRAMLAMPAK